MTQILLISTPLDPIAVSQAAERRLRESPYYFLKGLSCQFHAGVLTLRGRVPLRQLKHFAEVIVERVEGVVEVANRIEVYDPPAIGYGVNGA